MLIGYARTSTTDQVHGFADQQAQLSATGCTRIFAEQVSAKHNGERPELAAMLGFVRQGDVVVVTKLDRLARSIRDLLTIVDKVTAVGGSLRILNLGIDTATPTGKLMLTILGGIGEFERDLILERQAVGIDAAKKITGKYTGRKPTAQAKAPQALELLRAGKSYTETAEIVGISRASVFRAAKQAGLPKSKATADRE